MRHRIEEIERLAMTGCGLPEGYSQPEQLLFLSLRILHWEFRNRIIGREQARREKKLLVDDFRHPNKKYHEPQTHRGGKERMPSLPGTGSTI